MANAVSIAIKTSTVYVTTDGVSHPAPGLALQHQLWLDVQKAVAAAQNEEIVEAGTFLEDDRGNFCLCDDDLPTFVADNSHLLLGILMRAFSAKSDNAEALGVDGARRQAPRQYLILEVDGPFDPNKATVYDALEGGASWVCTTTVDPRLVIDTFRKIYTESLLDATGTESVPGLAELKERARNLAKALGAEGWL